MPAVIVFIVLLPWAALSLAQSEEADRLFASEEWESAAGAYAKVTEAEPTNGRAWLRLGVAFLSFGRAGEAIAALEKAEELSWIPPLTRFHLARASALASRKEQALEWLDKAVAAGYSSPDALASEEAFSGIRADARFAEIVEKARIASEPCEHAEEFRQFDFWLGEWVVTSGGQLAGENRIERAEKGCLLLENWTSAGGGSGKSMNFYDPATKRWNQIWVDASGSNIVASGSFRDGAMRFEGEHHYLGAPTELFRMSFTPKEDGTVRQLIEQSKDGGRTWYVWFDGLYRKKD